VQVQVLAVFDSKVFDFLVVVDIIAEVEALGVAAPGIVALGLVAFGLEATVL